MTKIKPKKKKSFVLRAALLIFMVYIVYMLFTQQSSLASKKAELADLQTQISEQQAKNNELSYQITGEQNGKDSYAEEYARTELDYAKQGERVFVNID